MTRGRPKVITKEALQKLEQAFMWGCSNTEACIYADISESTFYAYRADNVDFLEKIETLKNSPKLKARMIINKKLDECDSDIAKWYLERKAKDEFSTKTENENTNKNVDFTQMTKEKIEEINSILDNLV